MDKVTIGVQSYTYRKFDIPGMLAQLQGTGITAIELWPKHLPGPLNEETVQQVKSLAAAAGVSICGFGVYRPEGGVEEMKRQFSLIRALGVDYISIDIPKDNREKHQQAAMAAAEAGVLLGLHNHGPSHHFKVAQDIMDVVQDLPAALGACVDTGHYLRAGQAPEDAIRVLGKRVHGVHLKDFVDEKTEVIPGTGRLNYAKVLQALNEYTDFHSALVIEYEANPDDPTPAMRQTVALLKEKLGIN